MTRDSEQILARMNAFDEVIKTIKDKTEGKVQLVVAIDGMAGAGKSTLAERIAFQLGAEIIKMDDFFLPPELRTAERLAEPGGNVHYERFAAEVASKLQRFKPFEYGVFDCSKMAVTSNKLIENNKKIIVVEGSYCMRPEFRGLYDLKIFMKVDQETQMQRIIARNGEERAQNFKDKWIPMENAYFEAYAVEEACDVVIGQNE